MDFASKITWEIQHRFRPNFVRRVRGACTLRVSLFFVLKSCTFTLPFVFILLFCNHSGQSPLSCNWSKSPNNCTVLETIRFFPSHPNTVLQNSYDRFTSTRGPSNTMSGCPSVEYPQGPRCQLTSLSNFECTPRDQESILTLVQFFPTPAAHSLCELDSETREVGTR